MKTGSGMTLSSISIESKLGSGISKSLEAEVIDIHVTSGDVKGDYNVTKGINLRSKSGDIHAKVHVLDSQESDAVSHERILHDPRRPEIHAASKGDLVLYIEQPEDVPITVTAVSDSGDIEIHAGEAFKGRFKAKTLHGDIGVEGAMTNWSRFDMTRAMVATSAWRGRLAARLLGFSQDVLSEHALTIIITDKIRLRQVVEAKGSAHSLTLAPGANLS